MPVFTVITENRSSTHLSQHDVVTPEQAIARHVATLPFDDRDGPFDEELAWLQGFAEGRATVSLAPVTGCKATWLWLEGASYSPKYSTYVVRTELE